LARSNTKSKPVKVSSSARYHFNLGVLLLILVYARQITPKAPSPAIDGDFAPLIWLIGGIWALVKGHGQPPDSGDPIERATHSCAAGAVGSAFF